MYFNNPVLIYGGLMVVLSIALLLLAKALRSEGGKTAMAGGFQVTLVWGVLFVLLGALLGFNHQSWHNACAQGLDEKQCKYINALDNPDATPQH